MSKYMYTTVYEEFTGIKPPEPKEHKPKRKRGYGHPYRMRLNMQNNTTSGNEKPQRHFSNESIPLESSDYNPASDSYMVNTARPRQEESHFSMSDAAPRVTYKKRRHVDHDARF